MHSSTGVFPTPQIGAAIHDYCLARSTPLPDHINYHHYDSIKWAIMESIDPGLVMSTIQARFLLFLGKLLKAKKILEVGVFTGYSALVWAEVVKGTEGGQVVCLDLPSESNELAKETLKKFGLLGRTVTIVEGDGAESLRALPATQFDMVFLDANKENLDYITCFEIILDSGFLAPGGIIITDHTLKSALVVDSSANNPARKPWAIKKPRVASAKAFNDFVMADERVEQFLMPAFDGLSMVRYKKQSSSGTPA